jgi:hypothetical protein
MSVLSSFSVCMKQDDYYAFRETHIIAGTPSVYHYSLWWEGNADNYVKIGGKSTKPSISIIRNQDLHSEYTATALNRVHRLKYCRHIQHVNIRQTYDCQRIKLGPSGQVYRTPRQTQASAQRVHALEQWSLA